MQEFEDLEWTPEMYAEIEEVSNEFDNSVARGHGMSPAQHRMAALPPPCQIPTPPAHLKPNAISSSMMREALQVFPSSIFCFLHFSTL